MSRLTEKNKRIDYFTGLEFNYQTDDLLEFNYQTDDLYAIDKLGKLEDLEDELGCPLDVVFKAIDKGIVIMGSTDKYGDSTIWVATIPVTVIIEGKHTFEEPRLIKYEEWCFSCKNGSYYGCVDLKDYKKTWWLKEDKSE